MGYSDRRVRSFRWLDAGGDSASGTVQGTFIPLETWMLAGQVGYTPYEGPSLANQNCRKLGVFDWKLEGNDPIFYYYFHKW